MWQSVINYVQGLWAYRDMSPDMGIRRQVNRRLQERSQLSVEDWAELFVKAIDGALYDPLLTFLYQQLQDYSGLDVGRIRPEDRLIEDLQIPLVCWFDWPHQLCDDFLQAFEVDISEEFDESQLDTVKELVYFLNRRLSSMDSVSPG
ncbi:MAG: hypothetical protein AAGH78_07055 [Cyanobacteria bacterium P01_H01_bin.58]